MLADDAKERLNSRLGLGFSLEYRRTPDVIPKAPNLWRNPPSRDRPKLRRGPILGTLRRFAATERSLPPGFLKDESDGCLLSPAPATRIVVLGFAAACSLHLLKCHRQFGPLSNDDTTQQAESLMSRAANARKEIAARFVFGLHFCGRKSLRRFAIFRLTLWVSP
jgi:hypothetical protein